MYPVVIHQQESHQLLIRALSQKKQYYRYQFQRRTYLAIYLICQSIQFKEGDIALDLEFVC